MMLGPGVNYHIHFVVSNMGVLNYGVQPVRAGRELSTSLYTRL